MELTFLVRLCLFLFLLSPFSAHFSSRPLLPSFNGNLYPRGALPVDLNSTSFDSALLQAPASHAVIEFFAHWCPACRKYKPHYDKIARLFNGPEAVHRGIIFIARVDCAAKINNKLCSRFSVDRYPMLLWGNISEFLHSGLKQAKDKPAIRIIDDGRTADRLLGWINNQLGSSYGLNDQKFKNENLLTNNSDPNQVLQVVYDIEEATFTAFDIILQHKIVKQETRASLISFLQLLSVHHPSSRCRKGSAEILVNFGDLFGSFLNETSKNNIVVEKAIPENKICGKEVPRGYWMFCRGSKSETRGFSCGLWLLLHSVTLRIEDGESQQAFLAICHFIHHFFICQECRHHFYAMCSRVSTPFNKSRDLALWLWEAHNTVNLRLVGEEASSGTGDPKFPKLLWPTINLCPSCYSASKNTNINVSEGSQWDRDAVFLFLHGYYGSMLESAYRETQMHTDRVDGDQSLDLPAPVIGAVAVPVGAAVAIAVISCAFGALACFWRTQQKNRKYILHSLKNI